ncbi:MAG: glycerate kinase [Bacteroidales bacterium]|nr:glycerate kinase [Candidatus Cryptobacteroides caccocaballi]
MRILIASDSYKGCLSSKEVAGAVISAIDALGGTAEVVSLPVADGGEGTVEALVDCFGGDYAHATVSDPLGRPVDVRYGIAGDMAIIECASACGLSLVAPEERDPLSATTQGLGELILDAVEKGCRRFLIGLGGSATNDGGMGMIGVEGFLEKTRGCKFTVACDVDTPYIGAEGASRVFGPQKGASPEAVELLENRLCKYAERILEETGVDVRDMSGAGAAGGLGGAFAAYLGAELKRGVEMVLDALDFDSMAVGADLVITGEGCSDYQTVKGKLPYGVLKRANAVGVPVVLMSGAIKDADMLRNAGFSQLIAVTPSGMPLEEAMKADVAKANISAAVMDLMHAMKL